MWLVVVTQIVVPLLLIGVIAYTRQPNRKLWLVNIVAFGMVILRLLISSRWDVSSLYLRAAIPLLYFVAVFWSYQRIRVPETQPSKLNTVVAWSINLALIVLMSGFLWFSLLGYKTPDQAVDLASPLKGTYVVLNGGVSPFTNGHFRGAPSKLRARYSWRECTRGKSLPIRQQERSRELCDLRTACLQSM